MTNLTSARTYLEQYQAALFIRRLEDMKDTHEIISFCIEPTEPCEWCSCVYSITPRKHKQPLPVADFGAHFCPNCGRSLK